MPEFPMDPEEFKRRLGKMREGYLARVPGKIAEVQALWARVRAADSAAEAERDRVRGELVLAAHTMRGSAPTLGCESLGLAAQALEFELRNLFASRRPLSCEDCHSVQRLIAALGRSMD